MNLSQEDSKKLNNILENIRKIEDSINKFEEKYGYESYNELIEDWFDDRFISLFDDLILESCRLNLKFDINKYYGYNELSQVIDIIKRYDLMYPQHLEGLVYKYEGGYDIYQYKIKGKVIEILIESNNDYDDFMDDYISMDKIEFKLLN